VLVEEPAGLLAADSVDVEIEPTLAHAHGAGMAAEADVRILRQGLELAH
jgi:hypothetical protein